MRQFLHGSDDAFSGLAQRVVSRCCVYRNEEMPAACQPSHARIGFESHGPGGVRLLVDHGVRYSGTSPAVRTWLSQGHQDFPSIPALRQWLRESLAPCYEPQIVVHEHTDVSTPAQAASAPVIQAADEVTDMEEVRRHLAAQPPSGVVVDADALYETLTRSVRGQNAAMRSLARQVALHLAKPAPRKPATLFAVGPTGVGKTSAAEVLCEALRGQLPDSDGCGWLRLDMAEYQEAHRVSQLVGSPQGYLGYGDGAMLVDQLRSRPRSLILFDEIEKAHPAVLRFLMNSIDAGRLSRASNGAGGGREVDCRQALFVFTSNLACSPILEEIGQRSDAHSMTDHAVNTICRRHLRSAGILPEILGRIGTFLVYHPLSEEARAEIVALSIQRVARQFGVTITHVDPASILALHAEIGGNDFGSRPVEQVVEDAWLYGAVQITKSP